MGFSQSARLCESTGLAWFCAVLCQAQIVEFLLPEDSLDALVLI
jgi:hypothetical protein